MKKFSFLFLLLLVGCIGSVNATATDYTYLEENATTIHHIIYSTSTVVLQDMFDNAEWSGYAPQIVDIVPLNGGDDTLVYYKAPIDVYRVLAFVSQDDELQIGVIEAITINNKPCTITAFYGEGANNDGTPTGGEVEYDFNINSNETKIVSVSYNSGVKYWDCSWNKIVQDDVTVKNIENSLTGGVFYLNEGTYTFKAHGDAYSGQYGTIFTTLLIFDKNIDMSVISAGNSAFEMYECVFSSTINLESNVDAVSVYADDSLIGVYDSGDSISIASGEYDLSFVKDGYYNITQTVTLSSTPLDISIDMETTHTPVTLAITDSEGGLTGVNLYIDGELTGTVGNNQDVSLPKGTHELIFEKAGYWNETKSITVDETLTDLSIRMYPESVFFKISNTPSLIQTYSNSEVNIALNIDPNDYAYGVKLYLTGQEVLDVRDSSNVQISKQDSYYLLDDFSSAKTVNLKINSGTTLGTNSLAVRVTGYNSIGTEFVTDTTIDYEIVRLPLSLTVPNWCIGSNSLTVIETEGETRTVTIKVEDSESNIIYTDTYTLEGFETHKFNIDFEETGDYKLYIQSGDLINTYIDVNVANPVSLDTKTITASAGSTGTVTVSIENPFTEPQYYRITIEGDPLVNSTKVDFSISPGSSKSQSISFTLLDELDYDSYSLPLKVYLVEESGMTEIYSDSVILNIGSSGSFIPFIDLDDGIIDTVITLVVDHPIIPGIIIIAGLGIFVFSGKKKGKKPVKTIKKPIVKKGGKKGGK
ncbi:hypothetical protein MMMIC1C10_11250 [Methanococcus maripaludis]|uniref:DUF3244 domain-containing protein n=1 Tax=Methanococcus maripaludis TaxID=39152 RepID=UPI00314397EB